MTTPNRHASEYPSLLLSLEAEQLAEQLEHALHDPSATKDVFFNAIDRYCDVLTQLEKHREQPTPALVKH